MSLIMEYPDIFKYLPILAKINDKKYIKDEKTQKDTNQQRQTTKQ